MSICSLLLVVLVGSLPASVARAAVVSGAGPTPAPAGGGTTTPSPAPAAGSPVITPSPLSPRQLRRANRAGAAATGAAGSGMFGSPTGATPPPATTIPPAGGVTAAAELPGEKDFNSCKKFPPGKRIVKLNMKPETDLGDLISWISSITCKQFVLPGTIPANSKKVTIIAPQLITVEEAYRLFLSALDSVGLTVAPSGKFLRIIETPRAKTSSIQVYGDGEPTLGESYVTRLIRVENADVNEVAQVMGRLKGEQGDVIVFAPQGALIVTDLDSNITRMLRIVRELDQAGTGEKVWIVEIKNTAATEMAQKLAEIFQVAQVGGKGRSAAPSPPGQPGSKQPPKAGDLTTEMMVSKIIPDERSNQLIIIANERSYARVLTLVHKLDVPLEGGDGRIHVYYCENANCDELAQTLGAVTGVSVSGAAGGRQGRQRAGAPPQPSPAPTPGAGGQGPQLLFEGDVRINFDRPTNSLIVVSSLKDYQSLRRVIERLDSPRKQIFVEALILEVTLDKNRELGGSFHGALPTNWLGLDRGPSLAIGGFNPSKTLNPLSLLGETMLAGLLGPVLRPEEARSLGSVSTSTLDIPSFGVLVKALQTNSDVDVLSNPHLLIMNNEEGEISVGSRIPFPVSTLGLPGAAAGAAGGAAGLAGLGLGGLFPQVQREKVALEMKLVPHVNEHDIIRLEVDEKISEVAPGASNLGPSTSERTAKTIVVAKDQQTILIGGLMSDKVINSVQKVPLLGDIPILGFFFRNTTRHVVKTNLIIALTPYVIADSTDLRRVLEKKMKERREFVERFGGEERPNPEAQIDYRRKRGMFEEINRAAREVEDEIRAEDDVRKRMDNDNSGELEPPAPPGSGVPMPSMPMVPAAPATEGAPAPAPPPASNNNNTAPPPVAPAPPP
ncbi:MAG TPA: type II secretion system secretin GspD [Polyangia bacterium]|jgi:general secretion pathway protein D|nr:type II secretion system secretin GspD [Polyangia bacterium]